ncbi:MAG: transposase [Bacteroidota bacterium]
MLAGFLFMEKFNNKYRILSARPAGWDYSRPGSYFITICTKNRSHFFGEIKNREMRLNEIGIIADKYWAEIPNHFDNTMLGQFVIMPNHVHGIIIINDPVETGHALSPNENTQPDGPVTENHLFPRKNILSGEIEPEPDDKTGSVLSSETGHALSLPDTPHFRFRNQGKKSVSAMIGSFKSAVSKFSRPINNDFGWQTRFYDHIIRSHEDYVRISDYIINNPANWETDKFYK